MEKGKTLTEISPGFAETLKRLNVSQVYIAKKLYANDWDEEDEKKKRTLTGRLRNKIDGSGRLTNEELFQIQNIVIEIGEELVKAGKKSIQGTVDRRKKTLSELFQHWEDEEENGTD